MTVVTQINHKVVYEIAHNELSLFFVSYTGRIHAFKLKPFGAKNAPGEKHEGNKNIIEEWLTWDLIN